jgi:hypothetical protein
MNENDKLRARVAELEAKVQRFEADTPAVLDVLTDLGERARGRAERIAVLEAVGREMREVLFYACVSLEQKPDDIPYIVLEDIRSRLRPWMNGEPAERLVELLGHPSYSGKVGP